MRKQTDRHIEKQKISQIYSKRKDTKIKRKSIICVSVSVFSGKHIVKSKGQNKRITPVFEWVREWMSDWSTKMFKEKLSIERAPL